MGDTKAKKTIDPHLRRVTRLPLDRLWDGEGHDLPATRGRSLDAAAMKNLLRRGDRRFAVVGVAPELRWMEGTQGIEFWKREACDHL